MDAKEAVKNWQIARNYISMEDIQNWRLMEGEGHLASEVVSESIDEAVSDFRNSLNKRRVGDLRSRA